MLKKAVAAAGLAAAIVGAGASTASAAQAQEAPKDGGKQAEVVDICNAPASNPEEKDSYTAVNGKKGLLPPLTVGDQKLSVILGLCSTSKNEDKGGEQGGDQGKGGDQQTPAPGGDGNNGGGNDDPSNPSGGDSSFPAAL